MSNLCLHASDPQSIGVLSKDNARRESHCCTSSHCQSDSGDLPDDHETSSEWKFEGHIYFAAGRWPTGKTYDDGVRAAMEEQYLPIVPVSVYCMEKFQVNKSAAEPDTELLELPIRGYHEQAKLASRRLRRNWIGAAALESEKIQGGIPLLLETQEKTDPRDTNRFLLGHGKLSCFRVSGKHGPFPAPSVWTRGTRRCMTAKTLQKSHEAYSRNRKGPRTPQCDWIPVSPLRYITANPRSTWRQKRFLCADFSKLPT